MMKFSIFHNFGTQRNIYKFGSYIMKHDGIQYFPYFWNIKKLIWFLDHERTWNSARVKNRNKNISEFGI